jgi:hypothetical protein
MFRESLKTEEPADVLSEQPELLCSLQFVYDGFFEVDRSSGMGIGPLSYLSKSQWLRDHDIYPMSAFWEFIMHCWEKLDPVYLEEEEKRSERERKSKRKSKPRGSRPTMGKR